MFGGSIDPQVLSPDGHWLDIKASICEVPKQGKDAWIISNANEMSVQNDFPSWTVHPTLCWFADFQWFTLLTWFLSFTHLYTLLSWLIWVAAQLKWYAAGICHSCILTDPVMGAPFSSQATFRKKNRLTFRILQSYSILACATPTVKVKTHAEMTFPRWANPAWLEGNIFWNWVPDRPSSTSFAFFSILLGKLGNILNPLQGARIIRKGIREIDYPAVVRCTVHHWGRFHELGYDMSLPYQSTSFC